MTTQPAPTHDYSAPLLDQRLRACLAAPALRLIFTGPTGSGKSTVLASVPVPESKIRLVLDFEDSMAYLDAGLDGEDLYLPRRHTFRMQRLVFPTLAQAADAYERLKEPETNVGALAVDNISLLQDQIADLLQSGNAKQVRAMFTRFDVAHYLPVDGIIARWSQQRDPSFWTALKLIPKRLVLTCVKGRIHFVASTEEGNLWKNYGKPTAEVVGKKANALKTWMQFTDAVIFLDRDPNSTEPPVGKINLLQPKMRIQGMNPSWTMDWPGFVAELEAAARRDREPIPDAAKVSPDVVSGDLEVESLVPERKTTAPASVAGVPSGDDQAQESAALSRQRQKSARAAATPDRKKRDGGPDWPTLFWTHVKTNNLNGPALLGRHNYDFEAACRELGLAPNGAEPVPA